MDLKLRFTEEISTDRLDKFIISFSVASYISTLPRDVQLGMVSLFSKVNYDLFDTVIEDYYILGGVVKLENPFFFSIVLAIKEDTTPIYLDIESSHLDEYLDYVKAKETLRNYDRTN